jgi:hypothetical protein
MTGNSQAQSAEFLTEREVAGTLRVSQRTLQWWRTNGAGPAFLKLEGVVRYRSSDLEAFITAGRSAPEPGAGK